MKKYCIMINAYDDRFHEYAWNMYYQGREIYITSDKAAAERERKDLLSISNQLTEATCKVCEITILY